METTDDGSKDSAEACPSSSRSTLQLQNHTTLFVWNRKLLKKIMVMSDNWWRWILIRHEERERLEVLERALEALRTYSLVWTDKSKSEIVDDGEIKLFSQT